jgi:hypothetical protein
MRYGPSCLIAADVAELVLVASSTVVCEEAYHWTSVAVPIKRVTVNEASAGMRHSSSPGRGSWYNRRRFR